MHLRYITWLALPGTDRKARLNHMVQKTLENGHLFHSIRVTSTQTVRTPLCHRVPKSFNICFETGQFIFEKRELGASTAPTKGSFNAPTLAADRRSVLLH